MLYSSTVQNEFSHLYTIHLVKELLKCGLNVVKCVYLFLL